MEFEAKKSKNTTGIIIAIVLVLLCCCTIILIAAGVIVYEVSKDIPTEPSFPLDVETATPDRPLEDNRWDREAHLGA